MLQQRRATLKQLLPVTIAQCKSCLGTADLCHEILFSLLDGQHLRGLGAVVVLLLARVPEHILAWEGHKALLSTARHQKAALLDVLTDTTYLSASGLLSP